jgi:DNA polymerase-1
MLKETASKKDAEEELARLNWRHNPGVVTDILDSNKRKRRNVWMAPKGTKQHSGGGGGAPDKSKKGKPMPTKAEKRVAVAQNVAQNVAPVEGGNAPEKALKTPIATKQHNISKPILSENSGENGITYNFQRNSDVAVVQGHPDWYLDGTAPLKDILGPGQIVAFDYETTGLRADRDSVRLCSFSDGKDWCVIDVVILGKGDWKAGLRLLHEAHAFKDCIRVAFNAAFEDSWLREALGEQNMAGYSHDAMMMMSALYGGSWSLRDSVHQMLGKEMDKKWQKYDWSLPVLDPEAIRYSGKDSLLTYELWTAVGTLATPEIQAGYMTLLEAIPAVLEMKRNGMPFDVADHTKWINDMDAQVFWFETKLEALAPTVTNWGAPTQREPWLEENLDPKVFKMWERTEKSKQMSFDDKYIEKMSPRLTGHVSEVLEVYLKWRKAATQVRNFGKKIQDRAEAGRLSCDLKIGAAQTGRMTCSKPNLQQAPGGEYRKLFATLKGTHMIIADYAQIEVRVGALLAEETKLFDMVSDGFDIHTSMAAMSLGKDAKDVTKEERGNSKGITFGIQYGMSAGGLAGLLGVSIEQAKGELKRWTSMFPKMAGKRQKWHGQAERTGNLQTISGRNLRVGHDARFSICSNYPVQGSAADVIYKALKHLVRIRDEQDLQFNICLVVHDEIILEAEEGHQYAAKSALELAMVEGYAELWPAGPIEGLVDAKICNNWMEGK